jgi:hypothetical protein
LVLIVVLGWRGMVREPGASVGTAAGETPSPLAALLPDTVSVAAPAGAKQPAEPLRDAAALFRAVAPPADAAAIEARFRTPAHAVHYVRVAPELFAGKASPLWGGAVGAVLSIPFPDGRVEEVVVTRTHVLGPDRQTVEGHLAGVPGSRVILAHVRGAVSAQIHDPRHGEYHLRPVTGADGETAQFFAVDADLLPPCGGSPSPMISPDIVAALGGRIPQAPGARSVDPGMLSQEAAADGDEAPFVVRLLFVYTQAVRQAYGSLAQVESIIDLSIASVNNDLSASRTRTRIELAGRFEVSLDERSLQYDQALTWLRGRTDGIMDGIHAVRDEVGADLVALGVSANDTENSLGIAYVLREPSDYLNPFYAFSVVQFSVMTSGSVLAHELGHNFGCAHDRENSGGGPGSYPYSYGYRFTIQDSRGISRQFRDIMAYSPGTRVPYFSNPRIQISSASVGGGLVTFSAPAPVGVEAGQPGEADNARTIEQNAFEVANFRPSLERPFNLGALVNVSTRALVGAGGRQLIGGFIVSGPGSKRLLVRAAGPSLSAFGVGGVLADPILRVFRPPDSASLAENDDWGAQPEASATLVRGFPFASGSKDSALLLDLPPGAYTANIEGVGGATGTALIEAYELDRSQGMKLVNLSTRGWAERSRPMVAGFVVETRPGELPRPKRLLIRVLGPTLTAFGVADVMGDPMLTLYDGQGRILISNDDWDPPTTNLGSGVSVRRGTVDQLSEQAIFDVITGLNLPAMQPVEPAVIVDLAPGSYTVVVQPFEDLASNQPERPGIGIVEVYEINPAP